MKKETNTKNREVRNFLEKIVLNAGVGRASTSQPNFEEKVLSQIMKDLSYVSGQKPKVTRARKSIAGFKIRENQIVGVQVTLRKQKMVDFFERLITIVLPRVRDFGGIPMKGVDQGGVLNIGFREQFVFPEINPEESTFIFPLGVSLIPKNRKKDVALEEYRRLGIPFKEKKV